MHIGPGDARQLAWWEYQALVWGHRSPDEEEEPEAPEADFVARRMERLRDAGIVEMVH